MSAIAAPAVSRATILRRDELVATLDRLVTVGRVIHDEQGRLAYAADAFRGYSAMPLAVVLPGTSREVSQVLRYCYETGLKIFPRGGGTSLAGGAVGAEDGIVLCLSLMNQILEIDAFNRAVRVEAGATNAGVSLAAGTKGLQFGPDPASRQAATIGGSIATNAGGARASRYGTTSHNVLALKLVLVDGEMIDIGGGELEASGFDLAGLVIGSEGMFGVIVEATLRVVPIAEARRLILLGFQSVSAAISCANGVQSAEIAPTAMEVLDRQVVTVCEGFKELDLPPGSEALLVIEVEGQADEVIQQIQTVLQLCNAYGPTVSHEVFDTAQIEHVWQACDAALAALGRLGTVRCVDVAVPPARLAEAMSRIGEIAARYNLRGAHMCRAGEGVVRSVCLYDAGLADDTDAIAFAMADVASMTTELGGELSGEHGIGVAKRDVLGFQLAESDMAIQSRLKAAFDAEWLFNNGKVFPLPEQAAMITDS